MRRRLSRDQVKYFHNEWFRIVGRTVLRGESGKEYKLLKAEGIKLNEQVFLPESGQMTFQLYFEPVDAGEKKVDYVEGNHETDWRIGGIVLDEKPQKLEKESDCLIRGKVLGHPSSYRLVLMGYYDDNRIQEPYAIIPVLKREVRIPVQIRREQNVLACVYRRTGKIFLSSGKFFH